VSDPNNKRKEENIHVVRLLASPSMKRVVRWTIIVLVAFLSCICFRGVKDMVFKTHEPVFNAANNAVDFLSLFRQDGIVDEALEVQIYNALSALEKSLSRSVVKDWPKLIWQTSSIASAEETTEMTSWKEENPDWSYRVCFLE
jgi:mannosyltransferase OCH1-like enzyme